MTKLIRLLLLVTAFVVTGKTYAQCPAGMISYWKMDDGASTTLVDYKGIANGTYSGIIPDVTGAQNNPTSAKDFDSVNADIAHNAVFDFTATSSFSIEMWVNVGNSSSAKDMIILGKGQGQNNGIWFVGIENHKPYLYIKDLNGNVALVYASSAITTFAWHHIVAMRNETGDLASIYVDGELEGSSVVNFTGSISNSSIMTMGYFITNDNPKNWYYGQLDEVAIYNKVLTDSIISNHYTNALIKGIGYCDPLYPVITSTPVNKAVVNTQYSYPLKVTGAKPFIYSFITKPTGMSIDGSGVITWTPTTTNVDAKVSVRVSNIKEPADTQSFRIYIAEPTVCSHSPLLDLKLDETSGTTYDDVAGAHDGTIVSETAPASTTGKIGKAQLFNATSGIDIPDLDVEFDWAKDASFSIEFWMKTSTVEPMTALARYRTDAGAKWVVGTNASGKATFELYDNSGVIANYTILDGTTTVADGAWHHIIAVRNGTNDSTILYVDGVRDNGLKKTYNNSFTADVPLPVTIGYTKRNVGDEEYHFLGSLDEVVMYSRAITKEEAASFFALPKGHCPEGNYPPVITSTPITAATEDITYSYTFTVEDIDDATVTLTTVGVLPSWLTFNYTSGQKTATLTGIPRDANIGANDVTLRVNDGKTTKDQAFTINVANVNDVPVKTTTPTTSVNEDVAYSYTLTFTDGDLSGDTYSIDDVKLPTWLTFTYVPGAKTATISGTPGNDDTGVDTINLSYSDGHVTNFEKYAIMVNPVNDLPVITAQDVLTINEDADTVITKGELTIEDPDNIASEITLTIQSGLHYTVSGSTITPDADYYGPLDVNVIANDLAGSSAPYPVRITVTSVNDAPVITSTPVLIVDVDNIYIYLFTAIDADNATLTRSVVTKPDWLTFSAATGVLTGTPQNSDGREHLVTLRVSDGTINIDQSFTITVDGITTISEVHNNEFVIYPVPASDVLNIKFGTLQEETVVNIMSTSGSMVESILVPANTDIANISVEGLEAGIYFCHIKNNSLNSISRFIIAK